MSRVIYYFSGTGNSLKVAKDVAALLDNTQLKRIRNNSLEESSVSNHDTIGIVFPVY